MAPRLPSPGRIKDALRGIPGFLRLLWRLVRDARVSRLDRALFVFTLGYLFLPLDLIPDWIPLAGELDDLVLVLFTLDRLLYRTDEEVLLEHWDGDPASLLALRDLLERGAETLPRWARGLLRAG
ncbi:MAG TPA: YkvA family protein [Gemmatimonadota bacterium]|nr:YkvA family protein [Gemmatimonadota bacterium]